MGQNQRRPGFLRWGEGAKAADADTYAGAESAAPETSYERTATDATPNDRDATPSDRDATTNVEGAHATADAEEVGPETAPLSATVSDAPEASPFLRDLVGAMRGVAESSRDTTVSDFRGAVDARIEELKAAAEERAGDLRRRSELDLGGIGDWERAELERVRGEAEQRRKARRELLEKELAEQQSTSERELEALRGKLADYERELDAFFAKLGDITDPAAFVAAAKRMPPPPDLTATPADGVTRPAEAQLATAEMGNGNGAAPAEDALAQRLAQLDERLGTSAASAAAEPNAEASAAAASAAADAGAGSTATATAAPAVAATAAPAAPAAATAAAETSTAIVVKGLGSFGAITSFKQALERVDGIRGVTLSLGPTGDFVYRASHADDFDLTGAIRSIEGPNAAIEDVDGQLRVTIERPR